jgi:hypothetical protein
LSFTTLVTYINHSTPRLLLTWLILQVTKVATLRKFLQLMAFQTFTVFGIQSSTNSLVTQLCLWAPVTGHGTPQPLKRLPPTTHPHQTWNQATSRNGLSIAMCSQLITFTLVSLPDKPQLQHMMPMQSKPLRPTWTWVLLALLT